MVARVQGFEYHDQAMRLQNVGCKPKGFDKVRGLVPHVKPEIKMARHDRHPYRVDPLRDLHRFGDFCEEFVPARPHLRM